MENWVMIMALIGGSGSVSSDRLDAVSVDAACKRMAPDLQTGTLLATRGDCLAVKMMTGSGVTHVAAVVIREGKPYVYDSTNGIGVRKLELRRYLKTQGPGEIYVYKPSKRFTEYRALQFESYLSKQLGRPYGVKHHLTGNRSKGIHCAEFMTDAFIHCRMLKAKKPPRVSPASLIEGLRSNDYYTTAGKVMIRVHEETEPPAESWYGRAWQWTRQASATVYQRSKSMVLCE